MPLYVHLKTSERVLKYNTLRCIKNFLIFFRQKPSSVIECPILDHLSGKFIIIWGIDRSSLDSHNSPQLWTLRRDGPAYPVLSMFIKFKKKNYGQPGYHHRLSMIIKFRGKKYGQATTGNLSTTNFIIPYRFPVYMYIVH